MKHVSIPSGVDLTQLYRDMGLQYPKFFKMDPLCKLGFLLSEKLLDGEEGRFEPREDRAVLAFSHAGSLTDDTLFSVDQFAAVNGLEVAEERDFEAYPIIGMEMDEFDLLLLNGEWRDFRWMRYNEAGVPVLAVNCIEYLSHTLYPGHAQVAYEYMRHFSRDLETGLTIYTPD